MFNVRDRTILLVIAGSRSYGLHNASSDVDVKGICIPPVAQYKLGIVDSFEQADGQEHLQPFFYDLNAEEQVATVKDCNDKAVAEGKTVFNSRPPVYAPDGAIYDLAKFFKLALNANPNILEALYVDESDIRIIKPEGVKLRENRDMFLSKKVVWSYQGYAFAQMKRIKSHRSWLMNPPKKMPEREDFGLPPDRSLLSQDEQNAFLWVLAEILKDKVSEFRLSEEAREEIQEKIDVFGAIQSGVPDCAWPKIGEITGATTEFIRTMQAERKYKAAVSHWKSYNNWKETRNPKRAILEEVCGYDSKHGMHLMRLMTQGREILEKGTLTVKLPQDQREHLMWVRDGNMPFEELEEWFEKEQDSMKRAVDLSSLPKKPDIKKADEMLINLQMDAMRNSE